MDHAETIRAVAKALQAEYERESGVTRSTLAWEDLHETAQATWCHLARVAINTYNEHRATTP